MRILKAEDDAGKTEALAAKGKSGTPQKGARERADTGAGANVGKPFPRRRAFSGERRSEQIWELDARRDQIISYML